MKNEKWKMKSAYQTMLECMIWIPAHETTTANQSAKIPLLSFWQKPLCTMNTTERTAASTQNSAFDIATDTRYLGETDKGTTIYTGVVSPVSSAPTTCSL